MPIFRLCRTDHVDWDEMRSVVVRAHDDHVARLFVDHQQYAGPPGVWLNPLTSTCVEIPPDGTSELIMVDFKAG